MISLTTTVMLWASGAVCGTCGITSTTAMHGLPFLSFLVLITYVYDALLRRMSPIEDLPPQTVRVLPTTGRLCLSICTYDCPRYSVLVDWFPMPLTYDELQLVSLTFPGELGKFTQTTDFDRLSHFYTRDHLGSVRELISSTGAITSRLIWQDYRRVRNNAPNAPICRLL